MDPITIGLLVGAGAGLLQGEGAKEEAKFARKREAEIARWSPWTGIKPERVGQPNSMNYAMQGALAGAQFGKQFGGATPAAAEGAAPGMSPSPNGPYMTEAEYAQNIKPMGLPETTPENGWLPMNQPQYPQGLPNTQYPQGMDQMPSPWLQPTIYGPSRP